LKKAYHDYDPWTTLIPPTETSRTRKIIRIVTDLIVFLGMFALYLISYIDPEKLTNPCAIYVDEIYDSTPAFIVWLILSLLSGILLLVRFVYAILLSFEDTAQNAIEQKNWFPRILAFIGKGQKIKNQKLKDFLNKIV